MSDNLPDNLRPENDVSKAPIPIQQPLPPSEQASSQNSHFASEESLSEQPIDHLRSAEPVHRPARTPSRSSHLLFWVTLAWVGLVWLWLLFLGGEESAFALAG